MAPKKPVRMLESRRWSILLYAVFLSAFLLAFFASFRTSIGGALSDSASRDMAMRSLSSFADAIGRISADQPSYSVPVAWYVFESPNDDGRIHTGAVFAWIPQTVSILSKASAADFEAYSASGDPVEFATYDSTGKPVANVALSPWNAANVALPATITGSIVITSLWSRSVYEIDRKWSRFSYPDSFVRAYRTFGRAKEYLWIFRVTEP